MRVSDGSRFEIELDEPPVAGKTLDPFNMVYEVTAVLPGEGDFDGIIEARWVAGPGQAEYVP